MRKILIFVSVILTVAATLSVADYYYRDQGTGPGQATSQLTHVAKQGPEAGLTGTMRPVFSLPDLQGKVRHITEWDGDVVAINFWATWCPPCIKEIPEFVELQERYAPEGLQFIGVTPQAAEDVSEFVAEKGMNYPVLVGEQDVIELLFTYGNETGSLPYTVIIDRNNRISFIKLGSLDGRSAEQIITPLL